MRECCSYLLLCMFCTQKKKRRVFFMCERERKNKNNNLAINENELKNIILSIYNKPEHQGLFCEVIKRIFFPRIFCFNYHIFPLLSVNNRMKISCTTWKLNFIVKGWLISSFCFEKFHFISVSLAKKRKLNCLLSRQ